MLPLRIRRMDDHWYTVPGAERVLADFFQSGNRSIAPGGFDDLANEPQRWGSSPDTYSKDDLRTLNSTMETRFSPDWAQDLLSDLPLPWLTGIKRDWDLIETPEEQWDAWGCEDAIREAVHQMWAPHRRVAVATKLLHLKRPAFFPVVDRYVPWSLAAKHPRSPDRLAALLLHLRRVGRENLEALRAIQAGVAPEHGRYQPTLVRLLDLVLWCVGKQDGPYDRLEEWVARVYR